MYSSVSIPRFAFLFLGVTLAIMLPTASARPAEAARQDCALSSSLPNATAQLSVEVSNQYGLYRGDNTVMLSDLSGMPLLSLSCMGPYAVFRLVPGEYRVMAFVGDNRSQEIVVNVPPGGTRVPLRLVPAPGAPPRDVL